jgi:hypothetical protein
MESKRVKEHLKAQKKAGSILDVGCMAECMVRAVFVGQMAYRMWANGKMVSVKVMDA